MAKKDKKLKVPKRIMGFKLSKGTRKDLKKLLRMFTKPDTHTLAAAAASGLAAYLAERFAEKELTDKAGRWLYVLNGDAISRQGPRIVDGTKAVGAALDEVRRERGGARRP